MNIRFRASKSKSGRDTVPRAQDGFLVYWEPGEYNQTQGSSCHSLSPPHCGQGLNSQSQLSTAISVSNLPTQLDLSANFQL